MSPIKRVAVFREQMFGEQNVSSVFKSIFSFCRNEIVCYTLSYDESGQAAKGRGLVYTQWRLWGSRNLPQVWCDITTRFPWTGPWSEGPKAWRVRGVLR
jgi:hypothetical protein